jgi:hypothetical protein
MTINWWNIISLGIVPLAKWTIQWAAERRDKRKREEAEAAAEAERLRLKAQRLKAIKEAKENIDKIDPSKIEV